MVFIKVLYKLVIYSIKL